MTAGVPLRCESVRDRYFASGIRWISATLARSHARAMSGLKEAVFLAWLDGPPGGEEDSGTLIIHVVEPKAHRLNAKTAVGIITPTPPMREDDSLFDTLRPAQLAASFCKPCTISSIVRAISTVRCTPVVINADNARVREKRALSVLLG